MFTILGGTLSDKVIVDVTIEGYLPVSDEQLQENLRHARGLDCKKLQPGPRVPLAVVGGGASINNHIDTLKNWQGDVWAINGAWRWCRDNGIDAVFCSVDPHPIVAKWAEGAKRAMLATQCHPEAFDVLKGADLITFETGTEVKAAAGTTASTLIYAGILTHHSSVTLFGCESCYLPNKTHAYQKEDHPNQIVVACGEGFYLTGADFYVQARAMADIINSLDGYVKEESGGLLRAFINNPKHWVAWVSESLVKTMKPA